MTTSVGERRKVKGGVGEPVLRPDGIPKVTGAFEYVNDLHVDGMLWAVTRRAHAAHARIVRLADGPDEVHMYQLGRNTVRDIAG